MSSSTNPINSLSPDPARCPLCGEPNQCALAADPNATECWCDFEQFPHELLAQVPEDAIRRACICQNCLEEYRESTNLPDGSP